jgi:hypothetical protein
MDNDKKKHSPDWEDGWKAGMKEAADLLKTREDALKQHIFDLLGAIDKVSDAGCLDHLDCWDSSREKWYDVIAKAKAAAKSLAATGRVEKQPKRKSKKGRK